MIPTSLHMRSRLTEADRRRAFASVDEGALSLDADGRIVDANERLAGLLLYRPEELSGRPLLELIGDPRLPERGLALERLARQGYLRNDDLPLLTRDGRRVFFDFHQVGILDGGIRLIRCSPRSGRMDPRDASVGAGCAGTSADVLVSLEALQDATRRELLRHQRGRRALSLLSVGIDRYGAADRADAHGSVELLSALRDAAMQVLRVTDRLAPAAEGVFLALLPDVDAKGGLCAAERLRTAIANRKLPLPGDVQRHATVSIGVATTRAGRASYELLHARAEANRRLARRSGGNRVSA